MDVRQLPTVQVVHDLERIPWPFQDNEWDAVIARYVLEHVSWRQVPNVLREIHRVLKPGGKLALVLPDTWAQMRWIQEHPEGWDSRDLFGSAGGLLFGDQDYSANSHRSAWSPDIATKVLVDAGFGSVLTVAAGARGTDMAVEAVKPVADSPQVQPKLEQEVKQEPKHVGELATLDTTEQRQAVFDKTYFGGGAKWGGYAHEGLADFPCHELTANYVMNRRPESVLEVGAARGYLGKKLEGRGLKYRGLEISKHCELTKVSANVVRHDVCEGGWPVADKEFDLCLSVAPAYDRDWETI